MELMTLACQQCGAPLEVPVAANVVTCPHCQTQLAVVRTERETFTETLASLAERASRTEQQLAKLNLQQELERIDHDWDRLREQYLEYHGHGFRMEPSMLLQGGAGLLIAAGGAFVISLAATWAVPAFWVVGGVFVLVGLLIGIQGIRKVLHFETARKRHQAKRRDLLRRIREMDARL